MSRLLVNNTSYGTTGVAPATAPPVTIAAWIYPTTLAAGGNDLVYLLNDAGNGNEFELIIRDAGGSSFRINAGMASNGIGGTRAASTTALSVNTWYHACGVYNSLSSRSVFTDGAGKVTNSVTLVDPMAGINNIGIGVFSPGPATSFSGRMAEVGIWNVALDDAEVVALAKGFTPPLIRPQSLVGYWPLFGNDSPELDRSKSNNNLTLTGSPVKADHPRIYYPHDIP